MAKPRAKAPAPKAKAPAMMHKAPMMTAAQHGDMASGGKRMPVAVNKPGLNKSLGAVRPAAAKPGPSGPRQTRPVSQVRRPSAPSKGGGGPDLGKFVGEVGANVNGALGSIGRGLDRLSGGNRQGGTVPSDQWARNRKAINGSK